MTTNRHTDKKISIFALIISIISIVVSIGFSARQCIFENKVHKLHIDPSLNCFLIRSRDSDTLEFVLKNAAPIRVVSLSVFHKFYLYFEKNKKYALESVASHSIIDPPGQWIFKAKLDPNESVVKKEYQILSQFKFYKNKAKTIIAAIFEITYYRESE